jgi:hypothetical protein
MIAPIEGTSLLVLGDLMPHRSVTSVWKAGCSGDRGFGRDSGTAVPVGRASADAIPAAVKRSGRDGTDTERDALPLFLSEKRRR